MVNLNWQPGLTLEEIEKSAIIQAFAYFKRNKTQTSIALGIAIRTLENKLEKYQMDDKSVREADHVRKLERENFQRRARGLPPLPQNGHDPQTGLRVESPHDSSAQHAVSLPVGEKVQEVSPRKVAVGDTRKAR